MIRESIIKDQLIFFFQNIQMKIRVLKTKKKTHYNLIL